MPNPGLVERWDGYFFRVCGVVSSNSRCLSRKIGAVLVRDKSIIATGYNGPARGVPHCEERYTKDILMTEQRVLRDAEPPEHKVCPRRFLGFESGEGLSFCTAGHAEANCITNAARMGTNTAGATLYVSCPIPCSHCLNAIINAGIVEVVCTHFELYDKTSAFIIKSSGLRVRTYDGVVFAASHNTTQG